MSPVATPTTSPCLAVQHFGRREARIDLHAQRLGARAPSSARRCRAKRCSCRGCDISLRHQHVRQADGARRAEHVEAVVGDRRAQRRVRVLRASPAAACPARSGRSPRPTGYARRLRSLFPPRRPRDRRSSCLRRIAAARPAGPAPTITTSKSMPSRGVLSASARSIVNISRRFGPPFACFLVWTSGRMPASRSNGWRAEQIRAACAAWRLASAPAGR